MVCYVVEKNLVDDNESPTLYYNITRRKKNFRLCKKIQAYPTFIFIIIIFNYKGLRERGIYVCFGAVSKFCC